jgi:Putative bacterial sensory transduction regulator
MPSPAETSARVRQYLDEAGIAYEATSSEALRIDWGTTAIYVRAANYRDKTLVYLLAPVLVEVQAADDQLAGLLTANSSLPFGKYAWHPDERMVSLEWALLGDFLDADELTVALRAVGQLADDSDERLKPLLRGRMPHVE